MSAPPKRILLVTRRENLLFGVTKGGTTMDDRNDREGDRGGPRDGHDHHDQPDRGRRNGPGGEGGGGADTRFLQLEMSQVMYAEAEGVVRPAFRELLLEAAKERLRERFGEKITQLAQLAVDELLRDAEASLEIEARIREHRAESRQPREELRAVFAARPGVAEPPQQRAARREGRAGRRGKRRS